MLGPLFLVAQGGCHTPDPPGPADFREELLDPENCATCHPQHYEEWRGSMHAYAAADPVFVALNARGQRETNGELGDFCVSCHAPLAVELGLTEDGLNLDQVPDHLEGVTCYFCHNVDAVEGLHNNPLRLAMDGIMRGSIADPVENSFHGSTASDLHDGRDPRSSDMCGTCHDIETPNGAHIERTYLEWRESLFNAVNPSTGFPESFAARCSTCHMGPAEEEVAIAEMGPATRDRHPHYMAGIDLTVDDFPNAVDADELRETQRYEMETQRRNVVCSSLCVQPNDAGAEITVWLHNEGAGHNWPSGATADRRAWVALEAFAGAPETSIYASGIVDAETPIVDVADDDLWLFRDRLFDADGKETHLFWEAASYEANSLEIPEDIGSLFDSTTWVSRRYQLPAMPERIESVLKIRPIGLDILDDLIASGDLDPDLRANFPTFEIPPTKLSWPYVEIPDDPTPPWTGEVDGYGSCISLTATCRAPELRD